MVGACVHLKQLVFRDETIAILIEHAEGHLGTTDKCSARERKRTIKLILIRTLAQ